MLFTTSTFVLLYLPVTLVGFFLLGRRSTARSLQAACLATGLTPSSVVTPAHAVGTWMFPHLAAVLFDSPEHMTR